MSPQDRVGSEFWKQVQQYGTDETGIMSTLTQTESGYPPPIEHIGKPIYVKNEMGRLGCLRYMHPGRCYQKQ